MEKSLLRTEHVALGVVNFETTVQWYKDFLGLGEVERRDDRVYLAAGNLPTWDLCLIDGETEFKYLSMLADDQSVVDAYGKRLEAAKVEVTELTDLDPGVTAGIKFNLPSGHEVRIVTVDKRQKYSWEHVRHFDAFHGPQEFNHVTLAALEPEAVEAFMTEHLDFRVSDRVQFEGSPLIYSFMRVTDNHHDVAVGRAPKDGLDHFAFVVNDATELIRYADRIVAMGDKVEWGPGRHKPGNAIFLYIKDPGGHRLEISTQFARILDADAEPNTFTSILEGNVWSTTDMMPPDFIGFVS